MIEIPTAYFLLTNQSYRPLAAQMVVLRTLTRIFDTSHCKCFVLRGLELS